jgi:hypothetical protein
MAARVRLKTKVVKAVKTKRGTMSDDLSLFVGAANEALKGDFRAGTWRVWERYDKKTYKGNVYVLAQDGASYEEIRPLQVEGLSLSSPGSQTKARSRKRFGWTG